MCAYKISQCLQISSGQLSATIVWAYKAKKQNYGFKTCIHLMITLRRKLPTRSFTSQDSEGRAQEIE